MASDPFEAAAEANAEGEQEHDGDRNWKAWVNTGRSQAWADAVKFLMDRAGEVFAGGADHEAAIIRDLARAMAKRGVSLYEEADR